LKKLFVNLIFIALSILFYFELQNRFTEGTLTSWFSLLFLPALFVFVSGIVSLIANLLNKKAFIVLVNIWILFGFLFLGEVALRQLQFYSTYLEKNNMEPYRSVYQEPSFDEFGFHRTPNSNFRVDNGEFIYERDINDWGYTGKLPKNPKPKNEIRFFVLGDSFCEGAGVSYAESVPQQLENYFKNLYPNQIIKFYNFGMSGSDAVFAKFLWDNKLKGMNPDGVIFLQNTTDIHDIEVRGGENRFFANNELSYKNAPSWEMYYASCQLFRAFVHRVMGFDFSLIKRNMKPQLQAEALEIINKVYSEIILDFRPTWVFTYPQLEEFPLGGYNYIEFENWVNQSKYVSNLFNDFLLLSKENNLTEKDIYWPLDRHFNAKGYGILSKFIAKKLEPEIEKIVVSKDQKDAMEAAF